MSFDLILREQIGKIRSCVSGDLSVGDERNCVVWIENDLCFRPERHGSGIADFFHSPDQQFLYFRRIGADRSFHYRLARNDIERIAALDRTDGQHPGLPGFQLPGLQFLEGNQDVAATFRGSMVLFGVEPCLPRPLILIVNRSEDAQAGPVKTRSFPVGTTEFTWIAMAASHVDFPEYLSDHCLYAPSYFLLRLEEKL